MKFMMSSLPFIALLCIPGCLKTSPVAPTASNTPCDRGDLEDCARLIREARDGAQPQPDLTNAANLLDLKCTFEGGEQGAFACWWLGRMHEEGLGMPTDPEQAIVLYQTGCRYGDLEQCLIAGKQLTDAQRAQEGNEYYRKGCNGNLVHACTALAYNLNQGLGEKNDAEAFTLFQKSCDLDDGSTNGIGCTGLAIFYATGLVVEQDPIQGQALLEKACGMGHAKACTLLAQ